MAKRFATERYSWERVTDEHERLYRQLLTPADARSSVRGPAG